MMTISVPLLLMIIAKCIFKEMKVTVIKHYRTPSSIIAVISQTCLCYLFDYKPFYILSIQAIARQLYFMNCLTYQLPALSVKQHKDRSSIGCTYTMGSCSLLVPRACKGSNGCLISLWTISVSFLYNRLRHIQENQFSEPFHLIAWWNIHHQSLTRSPLGWNSGSKKWKETLCYWGTVPTNISQADCCAACSPLKCKEPHISARKCSANLMPEGLKSNQPEWT